MVKSKRQPKQNQAGKKERFEVLLEDMNEKFDFMAESVSENTSGLLKLRPIVEKTANDVEVIKTNLEIMKGMLKRKVDVEEFEVLEQRVTRLENRF